MLVDEETPTYTNPAPNTALELMKLLHKKKYQPSPIDLSIMPQQFGGPKDPQTGPNNSCSPGAGTSTERIYGPMNTEEEEAVDIKKMNIRKPGNTVLTPPSTFDLCLENNDGLAAPSGKIDLGY